MRKRMGFSVAIIVLVSVAALTGCVKSKLPPAPSPVATSEVLPSGASASPTVEVGETVVSVEGTATTVPETTSTPLPAITPTGTPSPSPTPATEQPAPTATEEVVVGTDEFEYTVVAGDTLWGIAVRYGTTVEAIKSRNSLTSDTIYRGDKLVIAGTAPGTGTGTGTSTHVVKPGENLSRIASQYGTTVGAIVAANGIINPNYVYAGQELIIPAGTGSSGSGVQYHTVRPGETLWAIAMRYGTTPWAIASANGIANPSLIYAGRTLRIP